MVKYKIIFLLGIFSFFSNLSNGQAQTNMVSVTYNMAVPNAGVNDYITDASFKGLELNYRHFINENTSFGFAIGGQRFDQGKGFNTYYGEKGAFSGDEYRYAHNYTMMATSHYYFLPNAKVQPYAGIGIGTTYSRYDNMVGGAIINDSFWSFTMAPEVGILVPVFDDIQLMSNVKYNYSTANNDYSGYSYWGFNIGFAFLL